MKIKRINKIFSYVFYTIGIAKFIIVILVLMQLIANLSLIMNYGASNYDFATTYDSYSEFSRILAYVELALLLCSFVMIFISGAETMPGYGLAIGAVLIQLIPINILRVFLIFVAPSLYIKAGSYLNDKSVSFRKPKKSKKSEYDTDWFFEDKK